ncbi:MAG: YutD family protein [Streptococcaceae bacterium]|jgi:uncharacterized protein YutD|nr:YutD family protein [Streptococcaceae bacterium]
MRRSPEEEAARVKNYERFPGEQVVLQDDQVVIGDKLYRIVFNYREGFDAEKLEQRFSNILGKYDYIVGDWGYDQLRLRGFYQDFKKKVNTDKKIDTLIDYLYEYCNFGCSFFVLEKLDVAKQSKSTNAEKPQRILSDVRENKGKPAVNQRRKQQNKGQNYQAFIDEKVGALIEQRKPVIKTRQKKERVAGEEVVKKSNHFTIKKRS